jgi:hypothetical protein
MGSSFALLRVLRRIARLAAVLTTACLAAAAVAPHAHAAGSLDLKATMVGPTAAVKPGDTVKFTLIISINSKKLKKVDLVTLVLGKPVGVDVVSYAPGIGKFAPATNRWSGMKLDTKKHKFAGFTLTATVRDDADTVSWFAQAYPFKTKDPNKKNNAAHAKNTVTHVADLAAAITDGKTTIVAGSATSYTVTLTNGGPFAITDANATLAFSTPLNGVSYSPSAGAYDAASGAWTGLSLATGGSATLTVTGTVPDSASGTLTANVTVAAPTGTDDPATANNTASDTTAVTPKPQPQPAAADRSVAIGAAPAPNNGATITVTVTNGGPDATDFTASVSLPPGAQVTSGSSSGSGHLGPGQSTSWTFTVFRANGGTATATVNGNVNDPNGANDSASTAI